MTRLLDVKGLSGGYGSVQILYDIDLYVDEGEFVTIIGPNGCGKSTFIKTLFGIATYYGGEATYRGERIEKMRTDQLVRKGIAYVPQVNNVFPTLSVEENLQMGGNALPSAVLKERIERALNMFPDLRSREHDLAASLSGGERRRVEIARALASQPNFILLDEPLAGIDPIAVNDIRDLVSHLKDRGLGVLITDHNVRETLDIVDRAYIIHEGIVLMEGEPSEIVAHEDVRRVYLGERFSL